MALDASVTLQSVRGKRTLSLRDFYSGFRQTVLDADEFFAGLSFSALVGNQRGMFVKLGLRRAQAISLVNIAVVLTFQELEDGEIPQGKLPYYQLEVRK